jgi:hypothetical protein
LSISLHLFPLFVSFSFLYFSLLLCVLTFVYYLFSTFLFLLLFYFLFISLIHLSLSFISFLTYFPYFENKSEEAYEVIFCLCIPFNFFVFYEVRVVSKERRRLGLPRTSCCCSFPSLFYFLSSCFILCRPIFPLFMSVFYLFILRHLILPSLFLCFILPSLFI